MMHNRAGRKLRRTTSHRLAMFSNQLASLMTHERIQTTLTKAKEKAPRKESLSDRARRASGGRVETVRKERPEPEENEEEAAKASPRSMAKKGKAPRPGKADRAVKPAPKRGPSRTGPSKRGE